MEKTAVVASVITSDMLMGVLEELTSLLPICLPVMITFLGIRKAIAFVQHILRAA